jgi:predicted nucleic acid-binding protein
VSRPFFLDTNVFLYSLSRNPDEGRKRAIARALIDHGSGALSVQVLREFLHQATRPGGKLRLAHADALPFLALWQRMPVQEETIAVLVNAVALQARTGYTVWDSLIVAAAQALGCNILYTEDLQDGRMIDGLRIVDPFREGASLP